MRRVLLSMKITGFVLLLLCMQVSAAGFAQQKISIKIKESSIKDLLKAVERQTDYRFVYSSNALSNERNALDLKEASLEEAMQLILKGSRLTYALKEHNLVVVYPLTAAGDKKDVVISGKVVDDTGLPLPGVSVKVTGLSIATITDANGTYSIRLPDGNASLEFSFIGYARQIVNVAGRTVLNIELKSDSQNLQEVTVTGYTNYSRQQSASSSAVVSGKEMAQTALSTFDQVLQGRVSGLQVSSGSGQPGASSRVILRGIGTISGNTTPLYVLDGIPVENAYFQTLNPSDFESVTVLKDATSKAQYGSKGANGVIVITTKKGKSGKVQFNYKSQYGLSKLTSPKFNMMNTTQRLKFEEEIGLETGAELGPGWEFSKNNPAYAKKTPQEKLRADAILDSIGKINANWKDIFFRTGKFTEQQVDASGGNENVRFYSSLNYYKQDGIAIRSGLERYSLRNNVDFSAGKLSGSINTNLGYSESSMIEREGSSSGDNPLSAVYYALPYEYPYAPDGTLIHKGNRDEYNIYDQREGSKALERSLNTTNKNNQYKTILGGSLNYKITADLTAKTRFGIDFRETTEEHFVRPGSYSGEQENGEKGSFGENLQRNFSMISTSGLTYLKTLDKHSFEVTGLYELTKQHRRGFGYKAFGIDARLPETPAGGTPGSAENSFIPEFSGGRTRNALISYIALGRYTFNDRYTLNASYRYDGSSTLPPKNRWHGFYSVGIAWDVKKENFLADATLINGLKFRASYGTTASPFPENFKYLSAYSTTSYAGESGIRPSAYGSVNYDWEYAKDLNIGFDLDLLDNRIHLVTDVYYKKTENLFLDLPVSLTSGVSVLALNAGSMRNRGIEVALGVDVIRTEDLKWNVGLNLAYNQNKILSLAGSGGFEQGDSEIVREGLAYGSHYAPKWAGVDPKNGNPLYYDQNGNISSNYNATTMSVAEFGSLYPPFTGGFNTALSYKGISLSALFSFANNVFRYNNEDYYNENPTFGTSAQSLRMLNDRWKKEGDNAILPRYSTTRSFSSKDIQNASYLRLRNVNLSYALPKSLLSRTKFISGVNVFVQGSNLLTWTKWKGFDPEDSDGEAKFDYPSSRTYTFGLNVNF
ncbi:SusC/RagA family TonB-linked outer membrane protein [Pedobacter caeni]|uniref:TonB-linked outer membrane protein, SusC/RagA family n=1 Tax=Pedobacter caeni TaxID=288992 RepID=A0A1M5EGH5_9SPHI|nr:SusC/RagA family TonB-linked outer membrane protein [Pedobacter caeni]SHF78270.1 TonB-linked outer membrane protein, SusC/RagA family [Pedobacter caeni]